MVEVFTAGTPSKPVFSYKKSDTKKATVFTDRRIFHHEKGTSEKVIIWKVKQPAGMHHGLTMEIENPSSLKWVKHKEEPSCIQIEGTCWLTLASLREAVRLYVNKNPPKTPEETNELALLKAVSYWCWDQPKSLVSVDYDQRFEKAAIFALKHWQEELRKIRQGAAKSDEEAEIEILEDIISIRLFLDTDPNKKGTDEQRTNMVTRSAAKATPPTHGEKSSNKRDIRTMSGNKSHLHDFVKNKRVALAKS